MDRNTELGILGGALAFMASIGFGVLTWLLFYPLWPFLTLTYVIVDILVLSVFVFTLGRYCSEEPGADPYG